MSALRSWTTGVLALAVATLLGAGCGGGGSNQAPQNNEGACASAAGAGRSVSLGFEDVANPDTNWSEVERNLNAAGVNAIDVSAGRVEFTAFDWPAHPVAAAKPGRDYLGAAIQALKRDASGRERTLDITVDTLVPAWIKRDPSIAGVDASGQRSEYYASASALYDGTVGDRIVEYVGEIARRYNPNEISLTELMFDGGTFGEDDLRLFRRMTGRQDWPRTASRHIAKSDPSIGIWRSDVLAHLLSRARSEVRRVDSSNVCRTLLAVDAKVNWDDPGAGRPDVGDDYNILAKAADRIILWAYIGTDGKEPDDIGRLTRALHEDFPIRTSRFTVSIGLWGPNDSTVDVVPPATMADAVRAAETNGITSVNVTPMSLMTSAHWPALRNVWGSR